MITVQSIWILCATTTTTLALVWWQMRGQTKKYKRLAEESALVRSRHVAALLQLEELHNIMRSYAGGIGQRIFDCRSMAATLMREDPEIIQRHPELLRWLDAMDVFLTAALTVYKRQARGSDGAAEQSRLAFSLPLSVYAVPPPADTENNQPPHATRTMQL